MALSILATGLTVLLATQANSNQQAVFASELTRANMLARSKMIDLENEVMKDGLSTDDEYYGGDFGEEGYEEVRWEAKVEPVEIPEGGQRGAFSQDQRAALRRRGRRRRARWRGTRRSARCCPP